MVSLRRSAWGARRPVASVLGQGWLSTAIGPEGYQVTAISPEWQGVVVGDFCSLEAAEKFAESMREFDAGANSIANRT